MNYEKLLRRIIANNKMLALGVGDVDQAELDYIQAVRDGEFAPTQGDHEIAGAWIDAMKPDDGAPKTIWAWLDITKAAEAKGIIEGEWDNQPPEKGDKVFPYTRKDLSDAALAQRDARISELEQRLEIAHEYVIDVDTLEHTMVTLTPEQRLTAIDGIECRDATIVGQDDIIVSQRERIEELSERVASLQLALRLFADCCEQIEPHEDGGA